MGKRNTRTIDTVKEIVSELSDRNLRAAAEQACDGSTHRLYDVLIGRHLPGAVVDRMRVIRSIKSFAPTMSRRQIAVILRTNIATVRKALIEQAAE